jgi:L-lactate dehydrogenase (cytochrome)
MSGAQAGDEVSGRLARRYITFADLREGARRRLPRFAFDYLDAGANDSVGLARNWAAFDAVRLMPRACGDFAEAKTEVELFGRRYAAPIGIAPVGHDGLLWPGSTKMLARAAQRHRIPYMVGTLASATIEEVTALAPDVAWFQLYGFADDNHRITFDLVRRAAEAGAHALGVTIDVPVRSKRPREMRHPGFTTLRPTLGDLAGIATSPAWAAALVRAGEPRFANLAAYASQGAGAMDLSRIARGRARGSFSWDEIARLRDAWPRALVLKGLMHPDDAERAVGLGVDGILVSNHGGRQFDAAPASIEALPDIVARVGTKATVLLDSGVRSGLDVARALALGAKSTFAARAFMYALAAMGEGGIGHMARTFREDIAMAAVQSGCASVGDLVNLEVSRPA